MGALCIQLPAKVVLRGEPSGRSLSLRLIRPLAENGPVPQRPPSPTPRVLIPTVWACRNLHGSTSAPSRLTPAFRVFIVKGGHHDN
jgi:hypothetical protein